MKLLPLQPDSKLPFKGKDWHESITDDLVVHDEWIAKGFNLGFPLQENGYTVFDFDDKTVGKQFIADHPELCKFVVETARGFHVYFKGSAPTGKLYLDGEVIGDRKGNGYVVWIGSLVKGHVYRALKWETPPPVPEGLFLPPKREVVIRVPLEIDDSRRMIRARAYAKTIVCIEGRSAHNTFFRLVCWLRDLGLSKDEATAVIFEWNTKNCFDKNGDSYPWGDREIEHKINDVYSRKEQK